MMLITADTTDGYSADSIYVKANSTQVPPYVRFKVPQTGFAPTQRNPDGSFTLAIPNTVYGSTKLNP